jgi:ABC-type phosphate transport system substrate-binding protein
MHFYTPEKTRPSTFYLILTFSILTLGHSSTALGEHSPPTGQAFSDPNYVVKMAPEWINQEVKYDEKVGEADLVISLGQQTHPAFHKYVEQYAAEKGIKIVQQLGTCGATAKKLAKKSVNIGNYCCPPGKTDRLPGLTFHTIGIAPMALITHPDNPVTNLTTSEARDIFSGEHVYWSEVPGAKEFKFSKKTIEPVARLHCKKRPGHWKHILDNPDLFSPRTHTVGIIPDMIKRVSEKKTAIGYESLFMLKFHEKKGPVKVLEIDGHHPDDLNYVQQGKYPFYRTFSLTTWKNDGKQALAEELINSLMQYIEKNAEQLGTVPVSKLRSAGWKFRGDELVGEPDGTAVISENKI